MILVACLVPKKGSRTGASADTPGAPAKEAEAEIETETATAKEAEAEIETKQKQVRVGSIRSGLAFKESPDAAIKSPKQASRISKWCPKPTPEPCS